MYESCQHTETVDDRQIYCEVEAQDPAGDIAVVTELIDELLYEKGNARSDEYNLHTDRRLQMLRRVVSYTVQHPNFEDALSTNMEVALTHQIDKSIGSEHYGVVISWGVEGQVNEGRSATSYFMDIFPGGRVLTCVDEPDLGRIDEELIVIPARGGRQERPMTPYDYVQLFNELGTLHGVQQVETADS